MEAKVVAIIIILLIVIWFHSPWLLVVVGFIGYMMFVKPVIYGGWTCKDKDKKYMERCDDTGTLNRWQCEFSCLKDSERTATYENIKRHILDLGLALPIPTVFLYNIEHNAWLKREYEAFVSRPKNYRMFITFFSTPASIKILQKMVPIDVHVSGIVVFMDTGDKQKLDSYLIDKSESIQNDIRKTIEGATDRFVPLSPELGARYREDNSSYVHHDGREVVIIGTFGAISHQNVLVIDHKAKTVFHCEPNVTELDGDWPTMLYLAIAKWVKSQTWWTDEYVISKIEWLLESCPLALQSLQDIPGGGYCQTWSKFMALTYLLNPNHHPQFIFGHLVFMQKYTSDLLLKFMFYVKKTYDDAEFDKNDIKRIDDLLEMSVKAAHESVLKACETIHNAERTQVANLVLKLLVDIDAEIEVMRANPNMHNFDQMIALIFMLGRLATSSYSNDVTTAVSQIKEAVKKTETDVWFRERFLGRIKDYENKYANQCVLV